MLSVLYTLDGYHLSLLFNMNSMASSWTATIFLFEFFTSNDMLAMGWF